MENVRAMTARVVGYMMRTALQSRRNLGGEWGGLCIFYIYIYYTHTILYLYYCILYTYCVHWIKASTKLIYKQYCAKVLGTNTKLKKVNRNHKMKKQ